jgi:uncharacterized membrane protein (TIGR02234 family)
MTVKREYGLALLTGAIGAGLVIAAARQQWARAVFTQPRPLPAQAVAVSGNDLVPLASALALAALACLAVVIATRGAFRRAAGVLLALFGAGAGAAVMTSVTAAAVVSVAASKVASPQSAALSGTAPGSTTSGASSNGGFVVSGSVGHAVMTGAPWHVAVLLGALLVFAAGLATALRGPDWPVMSSRYDAPGGQEAHPRGRQARALDSATMWESLNVGGDPTGDLPEDEAEGQAAGQARVTAADQETPPAPGTPGAGPSGR